jgi:hypothetical protein
MQAYEYQPLQRCPLHVTYQQVKQTPLHFVAESSDEAWGLAVATLLLDRGADIEAKNLVW